MGTWQITSTHNNITCSQCMRAVSGAKYRAMAWEQAQATYTAFGPVFSKPHTATVLYIDDKD